MQINHYKQKRQWHKSLSLSLNKRWIDAELRILPPHSDSTSRCAWFTHLDPVGSQRRSCYPPTRKRERTQTEIALGVFLMIRTTRSSSIPFLLCASVALFLPYDYSPRSTLTKMMMMERGGWCSSCYCLVHWAICSVKWSRFESKRTRLETRPTWYWTLGQFGTKPSQFPDISS